jgi:hypothetical protein
MSSKLSCGRYCIFLFQDQVGEACLQVPGLPGRSARRVQGPGTVGDNLDTYGTFAGSVVKSGSRCK